QQLVGGEAGQLRGADRGGAVGERRTREVQRGQGAGQRRGQFGGAGGLERLAADDVDRRLRLGHGAVGHAGAGDDDGVERAGAVGRGLGRLLGQGGGGGQRGEEGEGKGMPAHGGTPAVGDVEIAPATVATGS